MKIIKNSGDIVEYDRKKLRKSLLHTGLIGVDLDNTIKTVEAYIYDGIRTKQIYKFTKRLLKRISNTHAARYNLRSALQQLGPAGFFFEKFVSLIFIADGYQAKTNLNLQGKCVSHEIDVIVRRADQLTMIECKFHAQHGAVSDVKVPMYILSRFNDLKDIAHNIFGRPELLSGCMIVTNNRFSSDAEAFANCNGLALRSWDYPTNDSLKTRIDNKQLYPITCLVTITSIEKEKLLIMGTILVAQLIDAPESLTTIGITETRKKRIFTEAFGLCNNLIK
jgi:hypothetical protein